MPRPLSTPAKKKLVISALDDIKARDILAVDVRKVTYAFDWIVVATAESARQTKALARHVRDRLREQGCNIIGIEGEESGEWILVDAGDIVAHIMQPAVRAYYDLEELWGEGKSEPLVNPTIPLGGKATAARKVPSKRPAAKKPVAKKKPAAKRKPAAKKKPVARKPAARKPAAKSRKRTTH